jgi:hypothetical protein
MSFAQASARAKIRKAQDALSRALDNLSDIEREEVRNWIYIKDQIEFAMNELYVAKATAMERALMQRQRNGDTEAL